LYLKSTTRHPAQQSAGKNLDYPGFYLILQLREAEQPDNFPAIPTGRCRPFFSNTGF
jgi:hypothetical protein